VFALALFACVPAVQAWGFGSSAEPVDARALEDKWAEDFEAPIYKVSQVSMDTAADVELARKAASAKARLAQRRRANLNAPPVFEWRYEGVGILIVVAYALTYLKGNAANRKITRTFEKAFFSPSPSSAQDDETQNVSSVFLSEFSEVGKLAAKDPGYSSPGSTGKKSLFSREAPDEYRCWCSGRRFLNGALVTLRLRKRHDLFRRLYEFQNPAMAERDSVTVECFFRDGIVERGFAFAIGGDQASMTELETSSLGKKDIARLCEKQSGPKDVAGRRRVSSSVTIKAESPELASDIFTDDLLRDFFGEKTYSGKSSEAKKCLKSIHCACGEDGGSSLTGIVASAFERVNESVRAAGEPSSEKENASKSRNGGGVLRFAFELPSRRIEDLSEESLRAAMGDLFRLVPPLVDVVGRIRLSDAQKEKASKSRARVAEEDLKAELKAGAQERSERLNEKKLEKMSEAEKRKWLEKRAKKNARKTAGRAMIRKG
jgi:hypothetical protein